MPYTDTKHRRSRSRSSGGSGRDRAGAARRRQEKYEWKQKQEHAKKLALMTVGQRDVFLADEQAKATAEVERLQRVEDEREVAEVERIETMKEAANLATGQLISEFASAITRRNCYDLFEGDWMEDPVEIYLTGRGFAEEQTRVAGIKLQINLALDCSNSMQRNGVERISKQTLWTMYLMLRRVEQSLQPGTLHTELWAFAMGDDGKVVRHLTEERSDVFYNSKTREHEKLGSEKTDEKVVDRVSDLWMSGEDTYIEPLLSAIEQHELQHGDHGAYRLDIIMTDGVLQHPKDTRLADVVQDRRDGNLQTVMLNFIKPEDWGDYPVPSRCVQYPADADSVMSLMKMAVGDWVNSVL